jgi:ribosomal protein S12 methylthiotransferase
MIRLMREEEKICKYLDIPLQHVDEKILKAMNRPAPEQSIPDFIDWVRKEVPGIVLRTSLIVGFPGETEKTFRRLEEFVRETRFDRLGAFSYSKEEGTPAASLPGQVPERVKAERLRRIMALQKRISLRRQKALVGSRAAVLVERAGEAPGILWEGRTQGQAPEVDGAAFLTSGEARPGEMINMQITDAGPYDLYGKILGPA